MRYVNFPIKVLEQISDSLIKKTTIKKVFTGIFLLVVFLLPSIVAAQTSADFGLSYGTHIGLGTQDIRTTIMKIINIALGILGSIVTIIIMYGGFVWMTAGGNVQKVDLAKKILINGVIGLVIVVVSYAGTRWIFNVFMDGTGMSGPPTTCTDGATSGCLECIAGNWVFSTALCPLTGSSFRLVDVQTVHGGTNPKQDVYLCSRVQSRFSNHVDATTVAAAANSSLTVDYAGGGSFPGTWQSAGNTVVFRHDSQVFDASTNFEMYIPLSITDASGLPLSQCDPTVTAEQCAPSDSIVEWDFSTGTTNDTVPPAITTTYPVSDAADPTYPDTNVSRAPVFTVQFDEEVDATTVISGVSSPVNGNIILEQLSGQSGTVVNTINDTDIEVFMTGNGFRFSLAAPTLLDSFTWYRITVQNIEDLCGNQMAAPLVWEFETNDQAPGISNYYPSGGNICPDTRIYITFGTTMYDSQVTISINGSGGPYGASMQPSLLDPGPYQVNGTGGTLRVTDTGNTSTGFRSFEFVPSNPFDINSTYSVDVTTDLVIDQGGNTLGQSWTFDVATADSCSCAPYISHLSPSSGQNGQCITVYGSCFTGTTANPAVPTNLTIGGQAATIHASAGNYLSTTVPTGFQVGTLQPVEATITYNDPNYGTLSSNADRNFNIDQAGNYNGPCLYSVSPGSGCGLDQNTPGTGITLSGIRLGSDPGSGNYATAANNVTFNAGVRSLDAEFNSWDVDRISTRVPATSVDGDVHITTTNVQSNSLPFDVNCGAGQACSSDPNMCVAQDSSCSTGYTCNTTSCICEGGGGNVGDPCDSDLTNQPQCDPDDNMCNGSLLCNTGSCTCYDPNSTGGSQFRVTSVWPNCNTACTNGEVGARLSYAIDGTTLNNSSIDIYLCDDSSCSSFNTNYNYTSLRLRNNDTEWYAVGPNMQPDSYYRVVINDNLLNTSSTAITNPNYDDDGDNTNESYSWTFQTGSTACDVTAVETVPDPVNISGIGNTRGIAARALSDQNCSGSGYLNAWGLNWDWRSDTTSVATVSINDTDNDLLQDPQQTVTAVSVGTAIVTGAERDSGLSDTSDVNITAGGGNVGDPCDSDTNTPQCDPDSNMCGATLTCNNTSCTCEAGGQGSPCDSDTNTPQCDPDDTMCASGFICNAGSCICDAITAISIPAVISWIPVGTDVCRNALIEAVFNQLMDASTINSSSFVVSSLTRLPGNVSVYTTPNGSRGCTNAAGCSVARFYQSDALPPSTNITVTISNNIESIYGVALPNTATWNFTTGAEICLLSGVEVDPIYHLYTAANLPYDYVATTYSVNSGIRVPIVGIPGLYDWSYGWSETDPDNVVTYTAATNNPVQEITSNLMNGNAFVGSIVTVTLDTFSNPSSVGDRHLSNAEAEVWVCENPWPATPPMVDNNYGFQTKYCRGNAGDNLLGVLSDPASSIISATGPGIVREYLFTYTTTNNNNNNNLNNNRINPGPVNSVTWLGNFRYTMIGQWIGKVWNKLANIFSDKVYAQGPTDVIGLRIYNNPDRLGPLAWYRQQNFPQGNPQIIEVDGFPAMREGNSVYISGAVNGSSISTYIYVFSYNDTASAENIVVFDQLIANFIFNTFTPAEKQEVGRDLERFAGATLVSTAVENYQTQTGNYPQLSAGSYIGAMSTSKWPSWQATLGNVVGTGLPNDPVDQFRGYCSLDANIGCWFDTDCSNYDLGSCLSGCPAGYDPETCWNEVSQQFYCPVDSSIYQYRLYGAGSYRVGLHLERDNWGSIPGFLEVNTSFCNNSIATSAGFCGDGNVQPNNGEQCEIGESRDLCNARYGNYSWHNEMQEDCTTNCRWPDAVPAVGQCGGYCGDDTINGTEVCDGTAGTVNNSTCLSDCTNFVCNQGYGLINGNCELVTCDPAAQDCSAQITNGTGVYNTCNMTVTPPQWEPPCIVSGCDAGYHIEGGSCVQDAPTVTITSPANNSSGGSSVTITYSQNYSGTTDFILDGNNIDTTGNNAGTYNHTFTGLSSGTHTLGVRLNTTPNSIDSINYANTTPPTVVINSPQDADIGPNPMTMNYTISQLGDVVFSVDGLQVEGYNNQAAGTYDYTYPAQTTGFHDFEVEVSNSYGNDPDSIVYEISSGGGGAVGSICDSNTSTPQCNPNDTLCNAGLTCNTTTCVCQGGGSGGLNDPTNLAMSQSGNDVILTWDDTSTSETGFRIERSSDGTNWTPLFSTGPNVTTYTDNNLPSPFFESFSGVCEGDCGGIQANLWKPQQSTYQDRLISLFTNIFTIPTAEALALCYDTQAQCQAAGGGGCGYCLDEGTNCPPGDFACAEYGGGGHPGDPCEYFDAMACRSGYEQTYVFNEMCGRAPDGGRYDSVRQCTRVYYRVIAFEGGFDSGPSNVVGVPDTTSPPTAPSGLTAVYQPTNSRVVLSWNDNSNNETDFEIERSVNNAVSWSALATVGADITTLNDNLIIMDNTYYYRVRATNGNGASAWSNTASAIVQEATIFVSSLSNDGDIAGWYYPTCSSATNGIEMANCICEDLASGSTYVKSGEWHAFISNESGTNANDNMSGREDVSYILPNGALVASDYSSLTDGGIDNPINRNENNGSVSNAPVWTDTRSDGTRVSYQSQTCSCVGWGNGASYYTGAYGNTSATDSEWTWVGGTACSISGRSCSQAARLYCLYYDDTPGGPILPF